MISDEIRNRFSISHCGSGLLVSNSECDKLLALADRIDAETVELPRGKDGRPIHVGDTVYDEFPDALTVNSITLSDCYARVKASGKRAVYDGLDPERLTHERPDSLERIADELEEWSEDNRINGDGEVFDRARQFSERIRKLAKKEDRQCQ